MTDTLAMSPEAVAALPRGERAIRLGALISEANQLVDEGIERFITCDGKTVAGVVILFSGGNDSTTLAHLMRHRATHAAHANTGVGIEETRQYVRDVCAAWGLPLLERMAPRLEDRFRQMVLDKGFPGPGMHWKMYQRLKERALRVVRNEIVKNPRRERVVFLAGRRRTESDRRADVPEFERTGSVVWISPLVNWTKVDMMTYRLHAEGVPRNRVSDLIHMSGECLCGSFAKSGEAQELELWFPEAFKEIRELEHLLKDREDIHPSARVWGWGGDPTLLKAHKNSKRGPGRLCGACSYTPQEVKGDRMNTQEIAAAAAPAKQKSPMLTSLERVVYDHCVETGDTIEEGKFSAGLQAAITSAVWEQIREARVQEKLELSVVWLKEQLAKERAGVRRPQDEPVDVCAQADQAHADLVTDA